MAIIRYNGVGIRAMSACVPQPVAYNRDLTTIMNEEEVAKMIDSVGIHERRVCPPEVCASDLCLKAAQQLMEENGIAPESIDMLLFMSQCPDYKIPATSCLLQHRLGLLKTTACMDLSLACSGYVYALSAAFAYASMPGIDRVLLCDGETLTKYVNLRDKVNVPLYGDAGTVTLIEKGDFGASVFDLNTDGSGEDAVKIPAGGCRQPFTPDSYEERECENGNWRSPIQIYMDGMDVFNFAISVAPKGVKNIVREAGIELADIDHLIFHQSNRFMTDFFVKRLKFDASKVRYSIGKYGNTSSASIPLTVVSELGGSTYNGDKVVMCGFGAGLSWGTAYMEWSGSRISAITEY